MATIRATIAAKLGLDTQDFIKGARDAGKSTEQLEKQVDQAATSVAELGEGLRKASRTATIAGGVIGAAILGGIGSCVYWLNSFPEVPPKGAIDDPVIKQWMRKNMEKRGDRYYLKPDK